MHVSRGRINSPWLTVLMPYLHWHHDETACKPEPILNELFDLRWKAQVYKRWKLWGKMICVEVLMHLMDIRCAMCTVNTKESWTNWQVWLWCCPVTEDRINLFIGQGKRIAEPDNGFQQANTRPNLSSEHAMDCSIVSSDIGFVKGLAWAEEADWDAEVFTKGNDQLQVKGDQGIV
jgi:hypothetical protein